VYYEKFEGEKCDLLNIHTEYICLLLCIPIAKHIQKGEALGRDVWIRPVKFLSLA